MFDIITTQAELRSRFWAEHPEAEKLARANGTFSKGQNSQTCTTRTIFCFWLDMLERDGVITPSLADRATL